MNETLVACNRWKSYLIDAITHGERPRLKNNSEKKCRAVFPRCLKMLIQRLDGFPNPAVEVAYKRCSSVSKRAEHCKPKLPVLNAGSCSLLKESGVCQCCADTHRCGLNPTLAFWLGEDINMQPPGPMTANTKL